MVKQSSIKLVAGTLALLLLVPALAGTNMQAADAATAAGIIVPLYTYPGGTWDTVMKTKNDHPDVPIATILNPASGPGGSKDSNYVSGIVELRDAGVIVLGYVSTAYTGRSITAVKDDTTLMAYYNTGPTKVTLTIKSVGLDGSTITGLWTVISGSGSTTGFTPMSYIANTGSQYTITVGEWQNYKFDH